MDRPRNMVAASISLASEESCTSSANSHHIHMYLTINTERGGWCALTNSRQLWSARADLVTEDEDTVCRFHLGSGQVLDKNVNCYHGVITPQIPQLQISGVQPLKKNSFLLSLYNRCPLQNHSNKTPTLSRITNPSMYLVWVKKLQEPHTPLTPPSVPLVKFEGKLGIQRKPRCHRNDMCTIVCDLWDREQCKCRKVRDRERMLASHAPRGLSW